LLSHSVDGIFIAEYEQGDLGEVLFRVTCSMGLKGIVSRHRDRSYGAGKCKYSLKVKNRAPGLWQRSGRSGQRPRGRLCDP